MPNSPEAAARGAAANLQGEAVIVGQSEVVDPTKKSDLDDDVEALRDLLRPFNYSEGGPLDPSFEKV